MSFLFFYLDCSSDGWFGKASIRCDWQYPKQTQWKETSWTKRWRCTGGKTCQANVGFSRKGKPFAKGACLFPWPLICLFSDFIFTQHTVTATVIRKSTEWACKSYLFLSLKVIRRILRKAKLVRFPKSPKQLILPQKRKMVAFSWEKSEEIALVQFIALFGELKKGKWLSFGAQHEYWDKAAEFIQEMVKTAHRRSSKTYQKLLFSYIHYNLHISIEAVYFVNDLITPENWCLENFLELVKMYIALQILQSFLMS